MSNSLRPHESQHARSPCPSPTPRVHPNSCPSRQWCYPAISSSVVLFSSCLQSLPASVFSNESTLRIRWPKYCPFPNPPNGSNSSKDAIPEEASRCAVGPSSYLTTQLLYGVDQGVVWFLLVKEANQFEFFSCLFIHFFFFLRIWWESMEAMKASLVKDLFAAAASCQSCPTLCDPLDGSPPGSSIPGIVQARILEWVAISFSNACMHAKSLQSCPTLCDPMDSSPPGSSAHRIL